MGIGVETATLWNFYLSADDSEIEAVTVEDNRDRITQEFESLSAAAAWYPDREIDTLMSELEPDENGHITVCLY